MLVAAVILLCVALILIVRAIRSGGDEAEVPVVEVSEEAPAVVAGTEETEGAAEGEVEEEPVIIQQPTATVELPLVPTEAPAEPTFTEIGPGATVVVRTSGGATLRLRSAPTTASNILDNYKAGVEMTVLDGPQKAAGYTWWKVRAPNGKEGWAAGEWLRLKTN
jgi:hypothetical protein